MPKSDNGWPVIESQSDHELVVVKVAAANIPLRVQRDCAALLAHVAYRVHNEVSNLRLGNKPGFQDDGGYSYRKIDGSSEYSNHASGTAIDLNWQRWPMFKKRMSRKERVASEAIAEDLKEVIRWGGNYRPSRVDEMHWEIAPGVSKAKVRAFIKARGIKSNGTIEKGVI